MGPFVVPGLVGQYENDTDFKKYSIFFDGGTEDDKRIVSVTALYSLV